MGRPQKARLTCTSHIAAAGHRRLCLAGPPVALATVAAVPIAPHVCARSGQLHHLITVPCCCVSVRAPATAAAGAAKLTSVALLKYNGPDKDPFLLGKADDLSTFGYFQRGTVKEMLTFAARTIARKTQVGGARWRQLMGARRSSMRRALC